VRTVTAIAIIATLAAAIWWHASAISAAREDAKAEVRAELHQDYLQRVDSIAVALADSGARIAALTDSLSRRSDSVRTVFRIRVDTLNIRDTVEVRAALDACDEGWGLCEDAKLQALGLAALERERADTLASALESTRDAWQTELKRRRGLWHNIKIGLPFAAAGLVAGILLIR
jgi:hypothetical protein